MEDNWIILTPGSDSWIATYTGEHSVQIVALFGKASIPTAFTSRAHAQTVRAEIQRLNADCQVIIGGEN